MRRRPTPRRTPLGVSSGVSAVLSQADADALVEHVRAAGGAPLVEPDPAGTGTVLATFLWQGEQLGPERRVMLDAAGLTDRDWFDDGLLVHVDGTDLATLTLRVPSDWRGAYGFAPGVDIAPTTTGEGTAARRRWWLDLMDGSGPDPLSGATPHETSWGASRSEAAMPAAPTQRWWDAGRLLDAAGATSPVVEERMTIAGVHRRIWLLAPGNHTGPRALVLAFDGATWAERMPIAPALSALDRSGEVPPFVVAMIDAVDPELRSNELTASPGFRRAVCGQLVPWIAERHRLADDPASRVAVGQSFGGLAAIDLALESPEVVGGAVIQSGSFWWPADDPKVADARAFWAERLRQSPDGVRLWMEAGLYEGDMSDLTRTFVADARSVGIDVVHREFAGAHDPVQWREGFVDGLAALLGPLNR